MLKVMEDKTNNDEIRHRLNNNQKIEDIWNNRQLLFLGRVARIDKNSCPRKLLSTTCERRRSMCRRLRTAIGLLA